MDELSQQGRRALDALRDSESPTDASIADGMARLEAELGPGINRPIEPAGSAGAGSSVAAKLAIGALIGAALVAGWIALRPVPAPPSATPSPAPKPTPVVVEPRTPAPAPPEEPADPAPAPITASAPPTQVDDPQPPAKKKKTEDEGSNLEEELRLVRGAATASAKGDHHQALDLLAEHKRRFPRGVLAGERELTRAKTLCSMGKPDAARGAADRYLAKHQKSHLRPRFEEVCR